MIRHTYLIMVDLGADNPYDGFIQSGRNQMKTVQIAENLRYISLDDDEGSVGIFLVHEGSRVRYTIEVNSKEELRAAIESFQANPLSV